MYDPAILKEFAARMYSRAATTVFLWSFLGVVIGLVIGLIFGAGIASALGDANKKKVDKDSALIVVILGAAIGGGLGYAIGSEKAFWMKLEAQKVLCMLQTEVNTRKPVAPRRSPPAESPGKAPPDEGGYDAEV